jgi:hypothetical protein
MSDKKGSQQDKKIVRRYTTKEKAIAAAKILHRESIVEFQRRVTMLDENLDRAPETSVKCSDVTSDVVERTHIIWSGICISAEEAKSPEPPQFAEFCLSLFLSGAKREALIGCLSERFERDCERYGAERARNMYWGAAIRSFWPLLRRGAARAFKWGVVVESVRRFSDRTREQAKQPRLSDPGIATADTC